MRPHRSQTVLLLLGSGLLLHACASGSASRRNQGSAGEATSDEQQAIQQDRIDEITRLCARKANTAVVRCWNEEYMRTGKKFEAHVTLMIVVSPAGTAEQVRVVASTSKSKDLQECLIQEARSWSYPEGKVSAPVNCSFFLRSSM
ncbi:MAG: AgmX/PglI C-terminal domain-containing protein [Myxococcales bacterium]|nr:AgmX/PglI C-terminal domain-containing protein [Myxococcota bacterium]MDW8281156.1 AgmX/PglI C-terminal domain-containing protein [Myxococcales bacterium]